MSDVRIYTSEEWVRLGFHPRRDVIDSADVVLIQYPVGIYVKKNRFNRNSGHWLWKVE